jgi:hypothetical protein
LPSSVGNKRKGCVKTRESQWKLVSIGTIPSNLNCPLGLARGPGLGSFRHWPYQFNNFWHFEHCTQIVQTPKVMQKQTTNMGCCWRYQMLVFFYRAKILGALIKSVLTFFECILQSIFLTVITK